MALRKDDIAALREAVRIDDIVGQYVTLRPAGVGSLKGLCPFHDERTPSFHVRPPVGHWHCFGCGEGGDVISFVQKINHMPFVEAVQWLADKAGMEVRDDGQGGRKGPREEPGRRQRLVEANAVAHQFFMDQMRTSAAETAREFLAERGFDGGAVGQFGLGFAPQGWDAVTKELRSKGFTEAELIASGIVSQGNRGVYDRFRGRLIWPIKDITGTVVGFGARRLFEDDKGPKYLNTPETALYKKSQVLYGLDLARRAISTTRQIVVVEGYTDVMACHLAGIDTAVATCGTAFGDDHVRLVRRLLGDVADAAAGMSFSNSIARGGEVIFTFDGDAAGQKAALKAFDQDQRFTAQTFVAVQPDGLDPCELRQTRGDQALAQLIAGREPLFAFAIRAALDAQDLRTAEGRVAGLRAAAPVVARIRDAALRNEYARDLAGRLGMNEEEVRRTVAHSRPSGEGSQGGRNGPERGRERDGRPDDHRAGASVGGYSQGGGGTYRRSGVDPVVKLEREALEVVLQLPEVAVEYGFDLLEGDTFVVPVHRAIHDVLRARGGAEAALNGTPGAWIETLRDAADEAAGAAISGMAVAPLPAATAEDQRRYAEGVLVALLRLTISRNIAEVRMALSQADPSSPEYSELFAELIELETSRRAIGTEDL